MRMPVVSVLLTVVLLVAGCATTPPMRSSPTGCAANEVRYCTVSGSRAEEGTCVCMEERAAQDSLENLDF
jgi:hypothetical protein